jgi:nucleoside-diphosphate-sugar epimerase
MPSGRSLVTGATGHLGANLVRHLLDGGHRVRVLLRPGSDVRAVEGLDVERVYGDVRDPSALTAAVAGCDRIHHCAALVSTISGDARHRRDIYDTNVLGTRHLLRAAQAAGVARVVVTGSFSAVGHAPARASDETVPFYPFQRTMPYEVSKVFTEHECLRAVAEGLDVVIATSCAILGPHDFKPSRMGRVLCDFANGTLRAYIPGGFEFVAARDIVQGHLLAMDKGRPGQRYIFSSQFVTVDELMGLFEEVTGRPRPRVRLPAPVMAGIAQVVSPVLSRVLPNVPQRLTPGAVRILRLGRRADCTRAREELGYQPTAIVDAIREAHAFFAREGRITRPAGGRA